MKNGKAKKDGKIVGVRFSNDEIRNLEALVAEVKEAHQPNLTVSELVRQSTQRWEQFYKETAIGNSLVVLKTAGMSADELNEFVEGIKQLKKQASSPLLKALYSDLLKEMSFNIPVIVRMEKERQIKEILNNMGK